MKKILFFIAGIWVSFMIFLVFRDKIDEFLGSPDGSSEEVVQKEEKPANAVKPAVIKPKESKAIATEEVESKLEEVPFAPLEDISNDEMSKAATEKVKDSASNLAEMLGTELNSTKQDELTVNLSNPFGLIITKFERMPSRFRLVSWKGRREVKLEDLEQYDNVEKAFPSHWLKVGVPYVEWMHPVTKRSTFKPLEGQGSKPRIQAISFEIRQQALSYSSITKSIGYLILKDSIIGGAPYEITSEMTVPLTSSYRVHCQQYIGANTYFHNLSGKRKGYKFGGWGYEYCINHFNFPDREITVTRKELKTRKSIKKVLSAPALLN